MKVLKLGTVVTDIASNTKGMLTHLMIHMGGNREYIFQPKGINPETGTPVTALCIVEGRIKGGEFHDVDVPIEILGTKGQDTATGFKGTIVALCYHINGCIHVEIKPEGIIKKTGSTIQACEFDIRRVKGPKVKPLEGKKLEVSKKTTPSPISRSNVMKR